MVDFKQIKAGYQIPHKRADNFTMESADQVNIGVMQASGGATKLALIFSRDVIEVLHETLIDAPLVPGGLQPQVLPDGLSTYRLQVANLTMSLETAENLVNGIRLTIDQLKAQKAAS